MNTFTTRMRPFVQFELEAARAAETRAQQDAAFGHLERAHVLGQSSTLLHVQVHWQMLRFGLRRQRWRDAAGQLLRLAGAATKTAIGAVPRGNTGGSNVGALRRMPVPPDLQALIDAARPASALTTLFVTHPGALTMIRTLASTFSLVGLLAAGGCMSPPQNLDTSLQHTSTQGRYVVTLQPPATPPAINQIHSWQVQVASAAGAPVSGARFAVDGGMPQHGHGLPTKPQVTREIAAGTYLLEGMKFSMTGWWEIKLAIDAPTGTDQVTFNTVVR